MTLVGYGQTKRITQREVYAKIVNAEIAHPVVVLRQAIHESANFKSKATVNRNNILGIRSGRMSFSSIDDCISFYKKWQDRRYKSGDYYRFITRIGYAEDPKYIQKLKAVPIDFEIE